MQRMLPPSPPTALAGRVVAVVAVCESADLQHSGSDGHAAGVPLVWQLQFIMASPGGCKEVILSMVQAIELAVWRGFSCMLPKQS